MRVLGIITARGGSKSILRKNLALVHGRSLLEHTAKAVFGSRRLTRTLVSTDDQEIATTAKNCGLDVPFLRPVELARDDTPTIPVLVDVLCRLKEMGEQYEAVFTLQPTNPLRLSSDIDGAIDLLERTGADSVIGFTPVGERHPARMKLIEGQGRVVDPPFAEQFEGQRRQDLAPLFLRDGSVYLTRTKVLLEQNSLKGRDCRAWIIPRERACNVDEPLDLALVEFFFGLGPENFPGHPADE